MSSRLDKATNISIILASAAVVLTLASNHIREPAGKAPGNPTRSAKGAKLPLPKLSENMEAAVLVMLSTECRFCDQSADFYRNLFRIKEDSKGKIELITFFREPLAQAEEKLSHWNLKPSFLYANGFKYVEEMVSGTPTIFMTDSSGIVKETWIGKLDHDRKLALMKALSEQCKTCESNLFTLQ
jgi:hypothetical protein